MTWRGKEYQLLQTKTDDALWLARAVQEGNVGPIEGVLVVYVDDLAFFAPEGLAKAFISAVQSRWKTSEPAWLGEEPVTFCGIELTLQRTGYRMSQCAYIRELLHRYDVKDQSAVPMTKWVEPERAEAPTVEEVREAQALTGALLWVATRTRPDLSYVVSRCGQQATKAPKWSVSLGRQALGYLKSTLSLGIDVPFKVGSPFSEHGLLSVPRTEGVIEVYTDASHSPGGDRSMQSVFILWKGVPVAWEATRQPFTTLSSAEAELVCMIQGVQLGESVQPLIDEMLEQDTIIALLGDNEASIRSFETAGSSWRNRHLRMRAVSGRERVQAGLLNVAHIPGEFQIADIGTKPLTRARMMQLLELVNVRFPVAASGAASVARVLSRVMLRDEISSSSNRMPNCLAGLVLLAMIPEVAGQPTAGLPGLGYDWLLWLGGVLVLIASVVWGWGRIVGFGSQGPTGSTPGATEDFLSVSSGSQGVEPSHEVVEGPAEGENDDEFTEEEWKAAQLKFAQMERESGLTFVQRAKLRKALARGDVIDPPVFKQRYGPPPSWYCEALGSAGSQDSGGALGSAGSQGSQVGQSSSGVPLDSGDQVGQSSSGVPLDSGDQVGQSSAGVPLDSGDQVGQSFDQVGQSSTSEFRGSTAGNQASGSGYVDVSRVSPRPDVQVGGSSGSGEKPVPRELTYEDFFEEGEGFRAVGTDLQGLMLLQGERVLFFLGDAAREWLELRVTSILVRVALVEALAAVWRAGPNALMFSGPQWQAAVEDHLQVRAVINASRARVAAQEAFPYVPWGQQRVHYLWRVLDLNGSEVLAYLGDRVPEWWSFRVTSSGFMTYGLFAVSSWLEERRGRNVATTFGFVDAGEAYMQSEQSDFEDDPTLDELPLRPRQLHVELPPVVGFGAFFDDSEVSSEGESTGEPSVASVVSAGSEPEVAFREEEEETSGDGSERLVGIGVVSYEAALGGLVVSTGDDRFEVPLPGWSLSSVEAVVQGLQTGTWSDWQEILDSVPPVAGDSAQGSVMLDGPGDGLPYVSGARGPRARVSWAFWIRVLVILWAWVGVVSGSEVLAEPGDTPLEVYTPACPSYELQVRSPVEGIVKPWDEDFQCDGSVLWELSKVCLIVGTWELAKFLWHRARRACVTTCSTACQTCDRSFIPLPLPEGIRSRARILFCLWRAGYAVDSEPYPEDVQSELFWLIGDRLKRLEDGEVSESASSE